MQSTKRPAVKEARLQVRCTPQTRRMLNHLRSIEQSTETKPTQSEMVRLLIKRAYDVAAAAR